MSRPRVRPNPPVRDDDRAVRHGDIAENKYLAKKKERK